jgi:hypothetical protein
VHAPRGAAPHGELDAWADMGTSQGAGDSAHLRFVAQTSTRSAARRHLGTRNSVSAGAHMDNNTPTQPGDVWSWVVIGVVFCAVTLALFGPFIWELTHSV